MKEFKTKQWCESRGSTQTALFIFNNIFCQASRMSSLRAQKLKTRNVLDRATSRLIGLSEGASREDKSSLCRASCDAVFFALVGYVWALSGYTSDSLKFLSAFRISLRTNKYSNLIAKEQRKIDNK